MTNHYYICCNCNKQFKTGNEGQKTCSMDCRKEYSRKLKGPSYIKDNILYIPVKDDIFTMVNLEDSDLDKQSWSINNKGYVGMHSGGIYQFILERKLGRKLEIGEYVDHIDMNKLNNTRSNLRVCDKFSKEWNLTKPITINPTSKYKGVYFHKASKKFMSRIKYKNSCIYLGIFINEIDAAKAYNEAAIKYHGEYATLNVIEE